MGGLIQPTPAAEEPDSSRRTIAIAVVVVIAVAVIFAFLLRSQPKTASGPPPYAASLKLSDFKMSAAENFVGATVSYVDGTITNAGDKTVTHVVVEVTFKDDIGQLAQRENIPMQVLKTTGPYPEAVDFSVVPLVEPSISRHPSHRCRGEVALRPFTTHSQPCHPEQSEGPWFCGESSESAGETKVPRLLGDDSVIDLRLGTMTSWPMPSHSALRSR